VTLGFSDGRQQPWATMGSFCKFLHDSAVLVVQADGVDETADVRVKVVSQADAECSVGKGGEAHQALDDDISRRGGAQLDVVRPVMDDTVPTDVWRRLCPPPLALSVVVPRCHGEDGAKSGVLGPRPVASVACELGGAVTYTAPRVLALHRPHRSSGREPPPTLHCSHIRIHTSIRLSFIGKACTSTTMSTFRQAVKLTQAQSIVWVPLLG
jgi:hypothetical protein